MQPINNKPIHTPDGWVFQWNHFVDLEPDNDLSLGEVWDYFDEDILYAKNGEYFIDLGFYGGYLENNKSGFFKLFVAKGDFHSGTVYEIFISRSTEEIKSRMEQYFNLITSGEINSLRGYDFDGHISMIEEFNLYSAKDNIKRKLTDDEYDDLAKPVKKG